MITRLFPWIGTGSLVALVAVLGLKAMDVWQTKPARPVAISVPDIAAPTATPDQLVQRPAVYYAAITERPLFEPSRRPYTPETKTLPPEPEPVIETAKPDEPTEQPPPAITLQGIMAGDERNTALVGVNGGSPVWVSKGDPVADWTVSNIGNDWIEISRKSRSIQVDMYK